jgi:uncharacterized membrane protein YoaK (UPF0700 family)
MSTPIHSAESALQGARFASWPLFAAAAGSVNATAFLACERFVTHVTGTVTRIGLDAGMWFLMFEYALVLGCFVLGAAVSALFRQKIGGVQAFVLSLTVTAVLLVFVATFGRLGAFGPFGGSIEQPEDFTLLSLLGFAMGLQNATVASATALALRTTHMTGPASDLGVHLGTALTTVGSARVTALRLALARGTKLVAFVAGAGLAVPIARHHGFLGFLFGAGMVVLATLMSLPTKEKSEHEGTPRFGPGSARAPA